MFANTALHDETHLRVLRLLQANPKMQQRELAATLGVSLGKTNFCLQALRAKGWLVTGVAGFIGSNRPPVGAAPPPRMHSNATNPVRGEGAAPTKKQRVASPLWLGLSPAWRALSVATGPP